MLRLKSDAKVGTFFIPAKFLSMNFVTFFAIDTLVPSILASYEIIPYFCKRDGTMA